MIKLKVNNSELEYDFFEFSGGEIHIKIKQPNLISTQNIMISARLENSLEVMKLIMLVNAVKLCLPKSIHLYLPYLPYARQDRVCDNGEAFSLKVFCNLINDLKLDSVTIMDCHSEVGAALLNDVYNISNVEFIKGLGINTSEMILISPDAGSNKKIGKLAQYVPFDSIVKCDKYRNVKTGQLTGFEVFTNDLEGKPCIIVDDICDGGGTFMGLAQELIKKNAGKLYLIVTHGIFSKGFDDLEQYFEKIYCTDSIKEINHLKVKQIKLF